MNNLINLNDTINLIIDNLNYNSIINLFHTNKYLKQYIINYLQNKLFLLYKIICFDGRLIYDKNIKELLNNIKLSFKPCINSKLSSINYYIENFNIKIKPIKKVIKMICINNTHHSTILSNKMFVIKLINNYKMSLKYFPYLHNDFEICNLILNNSSNYCYNNFKYCYNFYNDLDFVLNVINKNPECYYYLINNDNVQDHIKYNTTIINTVLCNQNSCYLIMYIPQKLIDKKHILSLKHDNIWVSQFINNYCIY